MEKVYANIETKGKKIGFMMDVELQVSLEDVLEKIPIYHCIRGFVEDCLASFNVAIERHNRDATENGTETVYSRRPYFLSDQQIRFLQSEEAKEMFSGKTLENKFFIQLRKYRV